MRDQSAAVPPVSRTGRRLWWMAAVAVGLAAAVLLAIAIQPQGWRWFWLSAQERRLASLVEAVGNRRVLDGRLVGGFKYGPLRPPTRGDNNTAGDLAILAAAGELQRVARDHPTPDNLHAWAVAQLVLGRYDAGIRLLEQLAAQNPANGPVQTDLSAAYAARASANDRPDDWPRALAAVERARGHQPVGREALFNRALAITALNLRTEATRAWEEYLHADPDSPWNDAAREHLADLLKTAGVRTWTEERPEILTAAARGDAATLAARRPVYAEQMRLLVEDELLPAWGDGFLKQDPAAGGLLAQAGSIAEVLEQGSGDRLASDAVHAIQAAVAAGRLGALSPVAHGLVRYGQARRAYEANQVLATEETFRQAEQDLLRADNPMSLWCRLHLAIIDYYKGQLPRTLEAAGRIATVGEGHGYVSLAARAHWMIGLSATLRAQDIQQLAEYHLALDLFVKLGESANIAAVHNLLAGAYQYLGDQRQVWRETVLSLRGLGPLTLPRRYHNQLVSASGRAAKWGMPEVSLVIADESLAQAATWQATEAFVEAHQYRARALASLGRTAAAIASADAARAQLAGVADPLIRKRLAAEIAQMEADVFADVTPTRAVAAAREALAYFEGRKLFLRVPRLWLAEGRAQRRLGDPPSAIASLRTAATRFEDERAQVPPEDATRISHFDDVWEVYRELFEALLTQHADDATLLDIAERGKARSLAEHLPPMQADWIPRLRHGLDAETAVLYVYFVQLQNETLVWVVSGAGLTRHRLPVTRATVDRHTTELTDALAQQSPRLRWRPLAATLYASLIDPLGLRDLGIARVVIVPDGTLARLPFTALWDARDQRFFVEQYVTSCAPSLGFLLSAEATRPWHLTAASPVLAVAADQAVPDEGLLRLPAALDEVHAIARAFPNTTVLSGRQATLSAVREGLPNVDVLHFAGHSVPNSEYPELSRFFLSDGNNGAAAVSARDLQALGLSRLGLVVFASCSAIEGPMSRSEGLVGLARAFLVQGASSVLAARWDVSDAPTGRLVQRFYAGLAHNERPALALARASRMAIREDPDGDGWAAWILISGEIRGNQ